MKNTNYKLNTIINDFSCRGRHFTIVHDGIYYLAIENKYITNGRLNKKLNGLEMSASDTLEQCVEQTKNKCDMKYYTDNGMTPGEAMVKIFGIPAEFAEEINNTFYK